MNHFLHKHLVATLLLLLSSLLPEATHAEDCPQPGEQEAVLTVFLDEDSEKENGWSMQCDGATIWDVSIGSLEATAGIRMRKHRPFVVDTACIPETATCTFTIEDTYGDGLLYPGYYTLTYGATSVAIYDRKPFHENSMCFGPECPVLPDEIAQDSDDLYFYLKLDENPEETEYSIECGAGNTILEGKGFTQADAFREIEEEIKVEPFACCTLTIRDSGNDGLKEQGDFNGNVVYLDWATHEVISYKRDVEFGTLSIKFGLGC
jgi:hypothetical protein